MHFGKAKELMRSEQRRTVMRGRPFPKGISGNPGGRPRVIADLHDLARQHAPAAITELARLAVKARSEAVRVAAARELLDRGFGKATQPVDWTVEGGPYPAFDPRKLPLVQFVFTDEALPNKGGL
jgi:hypothetical protein